MGGVLSKALFFVTEIIVCKPHYLGWKRGVVCLHCADLIASYTEDVCFLLIVTSVLLKSLSQSCLERRDVSVYRRVRTGG